jgi:hypothetical protein
VKAYITALAWDPNKLTDTQLESVLAFARSPPPVSIRVELLKKQYRADDVVELDRQLKLLVKDTAQKLQTTIEHLNAEEEGGDGAAEEMMSK